MSERKTLTERMQKVENALYDCNGDKGILTKVSAMYDYIIVQKAFKKNRKLLTEIICVILISGVVGLLTQLIGRLL